MEERYGPDYFHGVGSNYLIGYENLGVSTVADFVISKRGRDISLLDVGCAYGFLVKAACDRGLDAYGLDISPYAINRGRKITGLVDRLVIGSTERTHAIFGEDRFDVITALEVLEHLPEPELALKSFHRALKMGGLLLVTTPAKKSAKDKDETHISLMPLAKWNCVLNRLGFHVKAPYYFRHKILGFGFFGFFPSNMFSWIVVLDKYEFFSEMWRKILGYICMLVANKSFIIAIKK